MTRTRDGSKDLKALRAEIDRLNMGLLDLLQERAEVVVGIARLKQAQGLDGHDPGREEEMLQALQARPTAAFGPFEIAEVFKTIFRTSLGVQEKTRQDALKVRQRGLVGPGGLRVGNVAIGGGAPVMMAGPCAVEDEEQMERVAAHLASIPVPTLLRGGAFKPRTNPYSFQGLREEGLKVMRRVAKRHGLAVVTEVLDAATLPLVAEYCDMLQVGARNMYNTELLKALGKIDKPVLLKRSFSATLEELLLSAEYILSHGNHRVVLCERGIRTFERATRNTLDISAVPILKLETSLPVIVDLSHALGRRDIVLPCGRAALAAGADGLMVEVHAAPDRALSDGFQQLDLNAYSALVEGLDIARVPERGHVPARPPGSLRKAR
jgi:3-deoxy-7-phosphoheptulonate synthase/chorismate mutase